VGSVVEPFTVFFVISAFVIDGDTFKIDDLRFRLYGVNTPERGMPCYNEAKKALIDFLKGKVQAISIGNDRFGRALVLLWRSDGTAASYLFSRGLAIPYPYMGPPIALGYLADALRGWKPGCLFKEGDIHISLITFTYNPPGPDLEEVVLKSNITATVTILNKRWQTATAAVTPGTNTITVTNFLGNKGDMLVVHIDRTIQVAVAYVPKAFTTTIYPGER